MRRIFTIAIALICALAPVSSIAKKKNPTVTRYNNAVGKSSSGKKQNKKSIFNYTHTMPAQGARAKTQYVRKKYHGITGIALKSKFYKKEKTKLLVKKPIKPHAIPGQ